MSSTVRTLSKSKRDEVLRTACEQQVALEVVVGRHGRVLREPSRFLEAVLNDEGMHLVVAMPSGRGRMVAYRPGEDVEVAFAVASERYSFTAQVKGRCLYQLSEGKEIPALVLGYPHEVENQQRRAHYRVPLSMSPSVSIAFVEVLGQMVCQEIPSMYAGLISDISGGGVAVLSRQRLPASMETGAHLFLSFQLPEEPEQLNLRGVIRNVRQTDSRDARIIGIEFVTEGQSVQMTRHIELIQRFVMKQQREVLKKLRML